MFLKFWGTRGSHPVPGQSTVRFGGNTSCLEVRTDSGQLIVLDCGTGAIQLGNSLQKSTLSNSNTLLLTHFHWDHIQGFPFFSPFFIEDRKWNIFGPHRNGSSLKSILAAQYGEDYFPVEIEELVAIDQFKELGECRFEIGDVKITTQKLNHPSMTLGYRIEADQSTIVYVPDHEPFDSKLADGFSALTGKDLDHGKFVQDADILIHDAQYTTSEYRERIGWGHCTAAYAVDLAIYCNVKKLALFHHDPRRDDESVSNLVAMAAQQASASSIRNNLEVLGATEGLEIELSNKSNQKTA